MTGRPTARGQLAARFDEGLQAVLRGVALLGTALLGLVPLLAAPAPLLALALPDGLIKPSPDLSHVGPHLVLYILLPLGTIAATLPCALVGLRWIAGRTGWAAGGTVLLPLLLALATAATYNVAQSAHGTPVLLLALPFFLAPFALLGMRWVAGCTRPLIGRWCGAPIASPYLLPRPQQERELSDDGGSEGWESLSRLLADPATWRDLLWTAVNGCLAALVLLLPTAALVAVHHSPWLGVPLTLAGALLLVLAAPRLLRLYGVLARSLLAPTRQTELALRVAHLSRTRAVSIDTGAAELRRIERDLHDGAQARLVAMGMALDAAEQLFETDPRTARALVTEAKGASVKALHELRDLVRGIHPPVLADRGLTDAVHALALDLPLRVDFRGDLPGRPPAPVESAAFFTVSELLANVTKHAGARQVWIEIGHAEGTLRIGVTDDGRGGADPALGTGLNGVERRLAPFDGVLAVSSPPGGPTIVTMEIPCALSSPKTSSC